MFSPSGCDADVLRIEIQICSIDLIEPPQEIFCGPIYIVATFIIRKVVLKPRSTELCAKEVDLI